MIHGNRKFILGLTYMIGCFGICVAAIVEGAAGWDAVGIASLPASVATGLGVVVYGNVKEHEAKAKNGGGA